MNWVKIKLSSKHKTLFFIISLLLLSAVFFVDIKLLPPDLILLLPYIIIISFATFFIGDAAGLLLSAISVVFWFLSKTGLLATFTQSLIVNTVIKTIFITIQFMLVRYIKIIYSKIEELSIIDVLTELNNRRGFDFLARYELKQIARKGEYVSLASMDIDNFKKVNDTRGHAEGDRVLKALAAAIKTTTRNIDVSARLGGDEFCVLFPNADSTEMKNIISRMVDSFRRSSEAFTWNVSLSVGVFTTKAEIELEALLKSGDRLMYKAKAGGKNRIEYDVDTSSG
ncbi:MAG: GGDEF domain-containing protein [Fibrobacterota bacterium]